MLTAEQIETNFNRFRALCEKLEERAPQVLALVDHFETRLALAPASSRKSFHASHPGGFCDHSLRVLAHALKLNAAFGWNISKKSLIIASLFHDLGKLGDLEEPLYVDAEEWKQKKFGELYSINEKIPYMSTPHRSIYLTQHFGIKLSRDEMLAILLNDGYVVDENKPYCLKEPDLALCVMQADIIATREEKVADAKQD